jgi:hypothetical protein
MKLLEVVKGEKSSPEVVSACMQVGKKIKKVPVLAGNCFGFIGNRMLEFYGKEAQFLVEEGATPTQVCPPSPLPLLTLLPFPPLTSGGSSPQVCWDGDGVL